MQVKVIVILCSMAIPATACTSQADSPSPQQNYAVPVDTKIPICIQDIPTLEILSSQEPTQTTANTSLPSPSTTSPSPILWDDLPKLGDVILSNEDIEAIDQDAIGNLNVSNPTHELDTSCLLDCARAQYSILGEILTIVLLRARDNQEADNTVYSIRNNFISTAIYEYTPDSLPDMPPGSWVLVDAPSNSDSFTCAMGLSYGNIVIFTTYSRIFCENNENGRYCEGDTFQFALTSVEYLMAQIKKLEGAGYPK